MHSLTSVADTITREVADIGGNSHPMPISVTQEIIKGVPTWAVCLSVRNDLHEFTCESEHPDLPTAVKNALKGIRREVGDIRRRAPRPERNVIHGGPVPTPHEVSWHPDDNMGYGKGIRHLITGEFHTRGTAPIEKEPRSISQTD